MRENFGGLKFWKIATDKSSGEEYFDKSDGSLNSATNMIGWVFYKQSGCYEKRYSIKQATWIRALNF